MKHHRRRRRAGDDMIRPVSTGACGVIVAAGIGSAVMVGGVGIAIASSDTGTQATQSAEADKDATRPVRPGPKRHGAPAPEPSRSGRAEHANHVPAPPLPDLRPAHARSVRPDGGALAEQRTGTRPAAAVETASIPTPVAAPTARAAAKASSGWLSSLVAKFNNQTPRLYPAQHGQGPTGVVSGSLHAVDPDSPLLAFTVTTSPTHGVAAVSPDGSWTYTPDPPTAAAGGIDSFRVTVSDAPSGFAIHGLAGLLHLLSFGLLGSQGDTSTATVTVSVSAVAAANNPPVGRASITGGDPATGRVDGTVTGTDPDGDVLSFSAPAATPKGALSINASTGAFAYLPTATARHAAARTGATTAETTDSVVVTITDGRGGTAHVPLTVQISPANTPPVVGSTVVGTPGPATGVVAGQVTATDSDSDSLVFTAPPATAKGAVTIDAVTGAFTFTPTSAARQQAAAPDATDADRTDSFAIDITDGHGGTASAAVTVSVSPADQPPASAEQLRPADLSFEGFFRVPTGQLAAGQYATLAYGGAALASRIVDGQRHFFLTGHRYANDPVVEIVSPAALGRTPGAAPVADVWRYWGDIYGGRKITAEESDPTRANANWTEGLLWDEAGQRLLWSYGNWYAALAVNNPVLGATEFDADGSSTTQGAWRTTAPSQQTRSFAVFLSPAVSAAAGGATIGLGGKMQSINATASWGPSLYVIDSATGDSGTALPADALSSHPIAPAGQRTPRSADYDVARNPDGSLDSAGTLPPVNGVGFWTELDETTGAVFAHNGSQTRSALIYTGGQASGLIWYGPDGEHGVTDGRGYNGSGNHAENFRPMLWLVSEADLVAVAEGRLAPENLNPYAAVDLLEQFPELAFLNGLSAGQPVFAEDEGRLYVPFVGGDTEGGEPYPLIAVFSLAS